ncbi:MAG: hypothetical protein HY234_14570 [Acidobacteria bacterium]|nr:hypothetical protein [Acidobacteriota bacterium]
MNWMRDERAGCLTQGAPAPALLNLGYTYYAKGQIRQVGDTAVTDGTQKEKYTCDDLQRLLTAQRGPDTNIQRKYSYDYDRFGARWVPCVRWSLTKLTAIYLWPRFSQ